MKKDEPRITLELVQKVRANDREAYRELQTHVARILYRTRMYGFEGSFNTHKEDVISFGCMTVLHLATLYKNKGVKSNFAGYVATFLPMRFRTFFVCLVSPFGGIKSRVNQSKLKVKQFFDEYGYKLKPASYEDLLSNIRTKEESTCFTMV